MHDERTLWRYVDGELPLADAEGITRAAAGDPTLRARIEEMRAMKEAVSFGAPAPPPGFPERMQRLAAMARQSPIDLDEARLYLKRIAMAAALLAAVTLAVAAAKVLPEIRRPVQASPVDVLLGR